MENDNFYHPENADKMSDQNDIITTDNPTLPNDNNERIELNGFDTLPAKKFTRYLLIVLVAFVVNTLIFIFLKDYIAIVAIFIGVIILITLSLKKPKIIKIIFSNRDITVDNKTFYFSIFQSFSDNKSVDGIISISLLPIKRFSTAVSFYLNENDANQVMDLLSKKLPYKGTNKNWIDIVLQWFGI